MAKREFVASLMQGSFFDWVLNGQGSAILIAVAGSGKSTTIVRSLVHIPEDKNVVVLAFNGVVAMEMKEKIVELSKETGRPFKNVRAQTFHGLGFGSLLFKLRVKANQVNLDARKLWKLAERNWQGDFTIDGKLDQVAFDHFKDMYGSYVPKLVSYGKGQGIGILTQDNPEEWRKLIVHHDLQLESEDASEDDAIVEASRLLKSSNAVAGKELWLDFDDQLYLPLLWKLRLYPQDWVFIDEAQDTNPVRRALAKVALRPGGRLVAVGDPCQAIYGFTGASHDAIDLIKHEFNAAGMPLTVSYRCPKSVGEIAKNLVPHFSVHDEAPEGQVSHMALLDAMKVLGAKDAILCRNTKPLVETAYQLLAKGIACQVLGSEIGRGLIVLTQKMRAKNIEGLVQKLDAYREREVAKYIAKGEEGRAEGVSDQVECLHVMINALPEGQRTIRRLIERIEAMFGENIRVLTLSTIHKAKGREWENVAILAPELMPSKWARQDWQHQQEMNLMYVAVTRAQSHLIYLITPPKDDKKEGDESTGK